MYAEAATELEPGQEAGDSILFLLLERKSVPKRVKDDFLGMEELIMVEDSDDPPSSLRS